MEEQYLLDFQFLNKELAATAQEFITKETKAKAGSLITIIDNISKGTVGIKSPNSDRLLACYVKFMNLARKDPGLLIEEFNNKRYARLLASALAFNHSNNQPILDSIYIKSAIVIFEKYASTGQILILFRVLIKYWNHSNSELLRKHIRSFLSGYAGHRPTVASIKENSTYLLDKNGPLKVAQLTLNQNIKLINLANHFGFSDDLLSGQYFDEVAVNYAHFAGKSQNALENIQNLIYFLGQHNDKSTSKRCLVEILLERGSAVLELKHILLEFAHKAIGDPAKDYNWQIWPNGSQEDRQRLEETRRLINMWITEKFIGLFFDNIAIDSDRHKFWKKYTPHITYFKIFGSTHTKKRLKRDTRLESVIDSRFGILKAAPSDLNALVMQIKDYYLIEFSRKGNAMYAIPGRSMSDMEIFGNSILLTKLKPVAFRGKLFQLFNGEIFDINLAGRALHNPPASWMHNFRIWIEKVIGIST